MQQSKSPTRWALILERLFACLVYLLITGFHSAYLMHHILVMFRR